MIKLHLLFLATQQKYTNYQSGKKNCLRSNTFKSAQQINDCQKYQTFYKIFKGGFSSSLYTMSRAVARKNL